MQGFPEAECLPEQHTCGRQCHTGCMGERPSAIPHPAVGPCGEKPAPPAGSGCLPHLSLRTSQCGHPPPGTCTLRELRGSLHQAPLAEMEQCSTQLWRLGGGRGSEVQSAEYGTMQCSRREPQSRRE